MLHAGRLAEEACDLCCQQLGTAFGLIRELEASTQAVTREQAGVVERPEAVQR